MRIGMAAAAVMLALGGCGEKPADPAPGENAQITPDNPAGVTVSDARVRLPAVSGRPAVAYFTVSQASGPPRTITGVTIALAGRAEMHETMTMDDASTMQPLASVPIASGESVEFVPGGKHVMLFELDPRLGTARETELIVMFDNGDRAYAKARVASVAEAMEKAR